MLFQLNVSKKYCISEISYIYFIYSNIWVLYNVSQLV